MDNSDSLENLPYQQIDLDLVDYGIITNNKKMEIDCAAHNRKSQMRSVLNEIQPKLFNKEPKKFKSFLEILERSDDQNLEKMAERLG